MCRMVSGHHWGVKNTIVEKIGSTDTDNYSLLCMYFIKYILSCCVTLAVTLLLYVTSRHTRTGVTDVREQAVTNLEEFLVQN